MFIRIFYYLKIYIIIICIYKSNINAKKIKIFINFIIN